MTERQHEPRSVETTTAMENDQIAQQQVPADASLFQQIAYQHRQLQRQLIQPWLLQTLDTQAMLLNAAYQYYTERSSQDALLTYGAEWLLDNYYIAQRTIRTIRHDMPKSYYGQLPELAEGEFAGRPRIYAVAAKILAYSTLRLDAESIADLLAIYQEVTPLTMGELWAFPTMLRLGLIDQLTQALMQTTQLPWPATEPVISPLTLPTTIAPDEVIANVFVSLRMIEVQDWENFFENASHVEQALRCDPAGYYAQMDFETRDRYRSQIERLARASQSNEIAVANQVIALAAAEITNSERLERSTHVGYFLVDEGRSKLEQSLELRATWYQRVGNWVMHHPTTFYLGTIALVTTILFVILMNGLREREENNLELALGLSLSLIPLVTVAIALLNGILSHLWSPRTLPKLDFTDGIPSRYRTMVVVPCLLTSNNEVDRLLQQLEQHYLSNTDEQLGFALLTDVRDAPRAEMTEDQWLVARAQAGIQALNARYCQDVERQPFYLFHRTRRWNGGEGVWMGWERKRGKLHEFNRLLRGADDTSYTLCVGDMQFLAQVRYVITLDADTELPLGSAHRLIGTLAHPLNHAQFGPHGNTVIAGYTILQPRPEIKSASANQSRFARIFSGDVGLDLYTHAVSDVYQDLFGEGIYVGKGIYDVDAFERSLAGYVPENRLLSHDLFEGIHGRAGLVTDIVVYEEYPHSYFVYASRLHRWLRGDWQLLPWLLPHVPHGTLGSTPSTLGLIDRWKILDNLRRSLLLPNLLGLLIYGWFSTVPFFWSALVALTLGVPFFIQLGNWLATYLRTGNHSGFSQAMQAPLWRWVLGLVFLPYEALLAVDAIGRTLIRMWFTQHHLLEWKTVADIAQVIQPKTGSFAELRKILYALLWTLLLTVTLFFAQPIALLVAGPWLFAWLLSPQIAHWISQPQISKSMPLSAGEEQWLRTLARRTWLYFEHFAGPDDNWLPPDHFQETPRGIVAHRTSPTNLGLMLLSTLAAYDLGYEDLNSLALRIENAFGTMHQLERHHGHFLNWYATQTLAPLPPRYISMVDSGNLAASLLTLRQGLTEVVTDPILRWQRWEGLLDNLAIFAEALDELVASNPLSIQALQNRLQGLRTQILATRETRPSRGSILIELRTEQWPALRTELAAFIEQTDQPISLTTLHHLRTCVDRVEHHLISMNREVDQLAPWLTALYDLPPLLHPDGAAPATDPSVVASWQEIEGLLTGRFGLREMEERCVNAATKVRGLCTELAGPEPQGHNEERTRACQWCTRFLTTLEITAANARRTLLQCRRLEEEAADFVQTMEFGFLYNSRRELFHIGYNVDADLLDENYYDLLASEARIGSLVAIAKGDVPAKHWLHLGRPLTQFRGHRLLLSWSGTMFEYLMPALFLRTYPNTLLQQSMEAAIDRQIDYGREQQRPWGISESGFYQFDANQFYQYRAFGTPGLGLKRGLGDDHVVTPYASLLALSIRPTAVMANIDALCEEGLLGDYGFYEAIDYTTKRLPMGQAKAIVKSFMVHHQGMILLALLNHLDNNRMVDRFHANPQIASAALLLQEQIPYHAPLDQVSEQVSMLRQISQPQIMATPWSVPVTTSIPQVHYLSNGRFSTLVTNSGGGVSTWQETDLTRWRADTTQDNWGMWLYLMDQASGELWSLTPQPCPTAVSKHTVTFAPHQVDFHCQSHEIATHLEIAVAPNDDLEIRHIRLHNQSDHLRRLTFSSYGEVVLGSQSGDRRHPAFNKLFIESEYVAELNTVLYRRRPRAASEIPPWMAHLLVVEPNQPISHWHESDRRHFLGRGGTEAAPAMFVNASNPGFSNRTGATATLDPIMALGQELTLAPHDTADVAVITIAGKSRETVLNLAQRYQDWMTIRQAFAQSRVRSEQELRQLDFTSAQLADQQRILSALYYPNAGLRPESERLAANQLGQSGLWPYAISGDYPILLVRIRDDEEVMLVQELVRAHTYWRNRNIKIDLVILNDKESGYNQELQGQLYSLLRRTQSDLWLNQRGGIFLVRRDMMDDASRTLLLTAARVVLDGANGVLAEQLGKIRTPTQPLPLFIPSHSLDEIVEPTPPLLRPLDLQFDNGFGGFSADGHEYVIYVDSSTPERRWTPAPWSNIIANEQFGTLVTEAGFGYTWALNSGENRLTPWSNDPVCDRPGEALYLRDEETGALWSSTPLPAVGEDLAPYLVRHGAGYSIFEHHRHGLKQKVQLIVAPSAPVKFVTLQLKNCWQRVRRITATYYAEWVLGVNRDEMQHYIISEYDTQSGALLARNPYHSEFGDRIAFLTANREFHGLTTDRTEFLGRLGDLGRPAALDRIGLSGTVQAGLDPCAAYQVHLDLQPGETVKVHFLLGQGADRAEVAKLIGAYRDPHQIQAAWQQVCAFWDNLLGTVQVTTPEPAMDLLLNRWLLYQNLACRIWGRSAFYQSSGAYGFRDQLQDVMALAHAYPELARAQILRAARHQFEAGDVLHWWHPPSGRGVRTRIADDLLWLPYVTAHYVTATGDHAILAEQIPFLSGPPLDRHEEERYDHYAHSPQTYTLYTHCCRALERGLTAGSHGLPRFGGGDWNDGMNRVGIEGDGESVWLGWFLCATLERFADVIEDLDKMDEAKEYRRQASQLRQTLEEQAWDGDWYRRGYYDDGSPLGSSRSEECQIDAIAQSWSVLSNCGEVSQRAVTAMAAVDTRLIHRDAQLIQLFDPPFDQTTHDPGYIKGYPPGIRENGGQYTHAALWTVWAYAQLGQGDRAEELFRLLNPISHSDALAKAAQYRVEPYVIAADVYSRPPYVGRGGWSWYTGSAGWMYRLGIEGILGLHRQGQRLLLDPCIPSTWSGFQIAYRNGRTTYLLQVENPEHVNRGLQETTLDGHLVADDGIPLTDDAQVHYVNVRLGNKKVENKRS